MRLHEVGIQRALPADELGVCAHRREHALRAVELGEPAERGRHLLEGERKRHDPAAVDSGRDRIFREPGCRCDLCRNGPLNGMLREPVATRLPAVGPGKREEARVLARAVVVDRSGQPTLLLAALEIRFAVAARFEQASHGGDLRRLGAVGRAGDRDLGVVEVGPGANERKRLDRLRAGAEEADERRISGRRDDLSTAHGNGVDAVARLDGRAAPDGYADRVHAGETKAGLAAGRAVASRRLPQAVDRRDDQPVRHADIAAGDPADGDPRPRRERVRGGIARHRLLPSLPPVHAAGGRLDRPPAPPTDPDRVRPRAAPPCSRRSRSRTSRMR